MILSLSINNFVLIKKMEHNFKSGMTAIIGETGSGKSLILDSLGLILGARSESRYIDENNDVNLTAEFSIDNNEKVKKLLEERDFSSDDNSCLFRRIIKSNGKSKSYINGIPCSLNDLKSIGLNLVEIHSQHKTLDFLKSDNQLNILDIFSENENDLNQLKEIASEYLLKKEELEKIKSDLDEEQTKSQLLRYIYQELEDLSVSEGEVQDLEEELKILSDAENIISKCEESLQSIDNDNDNSIKSLMAIIEKNVSSLDSKLPVVDNVLDMIETVNANISEIENSLSSQLSETFIDEERYNYINNRLEKIYNISKKNYVESEKLFEFHDDIRNQFENINISDEELEGRVEELEKLKDSWSSLSDKISECRTEKALSLEEKVTNILNDLKMEGSEFSIKVEKNEKTDVNIKGKDKIYFLLRSNAGQILQPMDLVASGGELSRISLAIQSLISNYQDVSTIVFDEIDSGIGGTTANAIGKYLYNISKDRQLFCITHLPQVAVHSDNRITVRKQTQNNDTSVIVEEIDDYKLINVIAKMLGSETLDGEAIAQAKKMISIVKENR